LFWWNRRFRTLPRHACNPTNLLTRHDAG
jgi:hypothetical protein